jgi:hypothetical protein
MSTKSVKSGMARQTLKDIEAEVAGFTRNSLTVVMSDFSGSTAEIQINFDDSNHLRKKLVEMFSTHAFGELLTMHCKGETFGPINILIGVNVPSDPFGVK